LIGLGKVALTWFKLRLWKSRPLYPASTTRSEPETLRLWSRCADSVDSSECILVRRLFGDAVYTAEVI